MDPEEPRHFNAARRRDAVHHRQALRAAARRRLGRGDTTVCARELARDAGLPVASLYRLLPRAVLRAQTVHADPTPADVLLILAANSSVTATRGASPERRRARLMTRV
jgi:hypothetical protein